MTKNPFTISFGKKPLLYIERSLIIDEITDELSSDIIQNQCFMLTGVRGSGKTVTMTAIESKLRADEDWIVIDLNSERDMLQSLTAKLYDSKKYLKNFFDIEINLSAFGIGVSAKNIAPVADIESALEIILKEIKKRGKRLLVTIDEVYNNEHMRRFAGTFQLLIRQELPIFLLMAGLYENIHKLEDEKNLTFLYRTPKYFMKPLRIATIKENYMETLSITEEQAQEAAVMTKGYPFAYQALGKYLWDAEGHMLNDHVIQRFDEALKTYVYDKIWNEMSPRDRWYMSFIVKKNPVKTSELLEMTGQRKNEFSQYRSRLKDKGIINTDIRGEISIDLPRFAEFVMEKEL